MPPIDSRSIAEQSATAPGAFTPRQFRDAMGQFATGVVVISTELDGDAHAMTANAFMSGSLEPPLVLVSVGCNARMHEKIRQSRVFGVSMLAQSQLAVSNHFAGKSTPGHAPKFERLHDLPVVTGASLQLTAKLRHDYPCGDHTLFVGEVLALRSPEVKQRPLLFHSGRYDKLAHPDWSDASMPEGFWVNHEMHW
jgi:flavin reductase (DIM6/NTAB) family NADH-FMN oxidoreductase RutF